ncbi:hypothetical protein C8T65DRAFT_702898 [Cerioporus squamosus]|nr:hypothetical protein C8T65DRAFT_702898 [Cerioporus squamosus]
MANRFAVLTGGSLLGSAPAPHSAVPGSAAAPRSAAPVLGPDGTYADLTSAFPEVDEKGVPLLYPRNHKNYPHVPHWEKDDYSHGETGNGDATVPGAEKRKPGRPSKKNKVTVEDDVDLDDTDAALRAKGKKEPTHNFKFLTNAWGEVVSDSRVSEFRGTSRSYWNGLKKTKSAPRSWKNNNTTTIQDRYYRHMKEKYPEFLLADGNWKIELFAILTYPQWYRTRKAEIDGQDADSALQAQAPLLAPPKKKNKGKSKGTQPTTGTTMHVAPTNEADDGPSLDNAPFQMPPEEDFFMGEELAPFSALPDKHPRSDDADDAPASKRHCADSTYNLSEATAPATAPRPLLQAGEPVSMPAPVQSAPAPAPAPAPAHAHEAEAAHTASAPKAATSRAPEPATSPAPEAARSPSPAPEPTSSSSPAPEPATSSSPVPEPATSSSPAPEPATSSPIASPVPEPAATSVCSGTPASELQPESGPATSSARPLKLAPKPKLRSPLIGIWKDKEPSAAPSEALLAELNAPKPVDPAEDPEDSPEQPSKKRGGRQAKKAAAKRAWPPSPSNTKPKPTCARIWHERNPTGTEEEFDKWYKDKSIGARKAYMNDRTAGKAASK